MRFVTRKESVARGCEYCIHSRGIPRIFEANVKGCVIICKKYDCPYEELDGYRTYEDYLEENGLNFYMNLTKKRWE